VPLTEALSAEVTHFAECIEKGVKPLTNGQAGVTMVRILEASEKSIKARGKRDQAVAFGFFVFFFSRVFYVFL
jgi:predicted dehydrogenase